MPHYSNWDNYFTLNKYFDDKEVEEIIDKAINNHDSSYAPPINGVNKLCNFFKENKIMVKIVTLRDEQFAKITEDWLNFHKIHYDMLVFAKDKRHYVNKDTILYIDDTPHLVEKIKKHIDNKGYNTQCILASHHLYAKKSDIKGVYKANNIDEIIDISKHVLQPYIELEHSPHIPSQPYKPSQT